MASFESLLTGPQIIVQCFGQDLLGHDVIRGYGGVHIPMTPGR